MEDDFDVLRIIRDIRTLKVQTKSLLSLEQRKISKRLAERAISCSESVSSCATTDEMSLDKTPAQMYAYLDRVTSDLSD